MENKCCNKSLMCRVYLCWWLKDILLFALLHWLWLPAILWSSSCKLLLSYCQNQWVFSDGKLLFVAVPVGIKVFVRIWIETKAKLNGKLHNRIFSASEIRSQCPPPAVHSCHWNGPLGWFGRNVCTSCYVVGWTGEGRWWQKAKKEKCLGTWWCQLPGVTSLLKF